MNTPWLKLLIDFAVFAVWLSLTSILWLAYVVVSVVLNNGHPWPYNPWLLLGAIPAGIGGLVALGIYGIWRIIRRR